jgi:hypothetical protein
MLTAVVQWQRRSAQLWTIGRFCAAFGLRWIDPLARHRKSRALEEFGSGVALLLLFAIFLLLVDSAQQPGRS